MAFINVYEPRADKPTETIPMIEEEPGYFTGTGKDGRIYEFWSVLAETEEVLSCT